jgi:two-component system response regulator DesR
MADADSLQVGSAVTRVLLGHRGALLRGALAELLAREPDLEVVAEIAQADEVLEAARRLRPDVVVLDFTLPGTVALGELCQTLCLTMTGSAVLAVLDGNSCAGVSRSLVRLAPQVGLIGTEATPLDLIDGVRRLARGESVLDAELAVQALLSPENVLTDREREVLRHARLGSTAKEIATSLCLSTGTVRNYLSRILAKTGARTRIEAIRIAQEAGWI